ncbi:FkbM family methyltransferase [Saccharolobus sp.]|uniref:FkbM family methyltransferase n=1 Tax=Saccharolobus sp. TaxID=2100761 RepID=UPI003866757F
MRFRKIDLLSELGLLGGDNVYFVKIDVEGYEIEVLQGMKKTLENTKCLMIETTYKHLRGILKLLPKSFRLLYSFKYPTTLNLLLENPNLTV